MDFVYRWGIYSEGSRTRTRFIDSAGAEYTYAIRINFARTNNEAEFEALLASLRIVEKMKVRALKVP
nr:putative ribonuclease H-like domain-containing protein [Tanacetum cinerariifolium]